MHPDLRNRPELSIVVALVSGATEHLRTCLTALTIHARPDVEILVPYDPPVAEVSGLKAEFPGVQFVLAEGLDTVAARAGASREHHDSIRTVGLRRARGRVVAMLEDVGRVGEGWMEALLEALDRHPAAAVVGGAMDCGSTRLLNRAICLADFWRYQPPLPDVASSYVSDANLAYRREALEQVAEVWADDFHETVVNGELARRGHEIWFAPRALIYQERGELPWGEALRERYVWGRSFAGTRVRTSPLLRRLIYAALSPVLPFVLTSRVIRLAIERERPVGAWLAPLALVMVLFSVWSFGEMVGYITGRPD